MSVWVVSVSKDLEQLEISSGQQMLAVTLLLWKAKNK